MIKLEDKRKQNNLSLRELGLAVMSLGINPNGDMEITQREAKSLDDWAVGYHEFIF